MPMSDEALGFLMVTLAGSATGLGAAVVFSERAIQMASKRVLAGCLGISAGVMLYVSFVEIFVKSLGAFEEAGNGPSDAYLKATVCFFCGCLMMKLVDKLVHAIDGHYTQMPTFDEVPERSAAKAGGAPQMADFAPPQKAATAPPPACCGAAMSPETSEDVSLDVVEGGGALEVGGAEGEGAPAGDTKLVRMGLMTALAIAIHNFPEGLATFVATLDDPSVGASLAIAIGIHNIPEGLCVSIPIYYATGDRKRAFLWAMLSGVTEPIGALIGWALLQGRLDQGMYGVLFGLVGGMMVTIVLHELLPTAHRFDPGDTLVTNSVLLGMMMMSSSLVLFVY